MKNLLCQEPFEKAQSSRSKLRASSSSQSLFITKLLFVLILFGSLVICTPAGLNSLDPVDTKLAKRQPKIQSIDKLERRNELVARDRRRPVSTAVVLPSVPPPAPKMTVIKKGDIPFEQLPRRLQLAFYGTTQPEIPPKLIAGLVFMRPELDLTTNFEFTVKLAVAPTADVTFYIEAETVMFDKCQIVFTSKNWDQTQNIKITQIPFFNPEEKKFEFPGRWKLCSKDLKFHAKEASFKVIRNKKIGAYCSANTDPHIITFDGQGFTMRDSGSTYYMVNSPFLTVQLQTAFCGKSGEGSLSCSTAVAIRYGKALYLRYTDKLTVASSPADNSNVECLQTAAGGHSLNLSDGTVIRIVGGSLGFINTVQISIASHAYNQVKGMCGNFNGKNSDDFIGGDGKTYDVSKDYGTAFGQSWRVPDDDNLFKLTVKAKNYQNVVVYQRTVTCKIPAILQGTGENPKVYPGTTIIDRVDGNIFANSPPVAPKVVITTADPRIKETARKLCQTVLIDAAANKIVDPKQYIADCLQDAEFTNSLVFIEGIKDAYLAAVRTQITEVKAIEDKVIREAAELVKKQEGLLQEKCQQDCNKRGECTPNGCVCKMGYTGRYCEQQIPTEYTIIQTQEKRVLTIEGSVLAISVSSITIEEMVIGKQFTVVLPAQPAGKVSVYMELPGFTFDKCVLVFDAVNWEKPQSVTINQIPYFDAEKGVRNLKLKFHVGASQDLRYHDKTSEINIIRQGGIGATCTVLNHPHITTFDKMQMDVMECGIFSLVESPILSVQIITQQIYEKVAVTRSLAFRYGKSVYIFDGKLGIRKASAGSEGVEVIATKSQTEVRFQLSDGTLIKAQRSDETISVQIEAASHYRTKTLGLCGNFDDNKDNDMTTPDKKVLKPGPIKVLWADGGEFAKTWEVTAKNNLFQCGATCEQYDRAELQINACECAVPRTLDGNGLIIKKLDEYDVISSVERYIVQIPPPEKLKVVPPPPVLKPDFEEERKKLCAIIFKDEEANKLVDPKPFINACLTDCKATGTFSFIDEIKSNYFNEVRKITKSMIIDPNASTKIAINIEVKLGFGNEKCFQGCNERGECCSTGCRCQDGYTGLGCEIKIVTVVKVIELPPPTIALKIVEGALKIVQIVHAGDGAQKPPTTLAELAALTGKKLPNPAYAAAPLVEPPANTVFPAAGNLEDGAPKENLLEEN